VKRLVLCVASAVTSCFCLAAITGGPAVADPAAGATVSNGTMIPTSGAPHLHHIRGTVLQKSDNWSGYAQVSTSSDTFTEVTDTFVVPTVGPVAKGTQYAADWVGIGGFNDPTLVQTGIQVVAQAKTRTHPSRVLYDAWTEVLPKAEKPLTLTISAGDTVTATVRETSTNMWQMEVDDITTGESAQPPAVPYTSSGLSAEAIHERPCVRAPCKAVDLAHLAQTPDGVPFGPGFYSVVPPGATPVNEPLLEAVANLTLNDIIMTNNKETKSIATPSGPSTEDDSFIVADGTTPPTPPSF
jgi:hypothetical protein